MAAVENQTHFLLNAAVARHGDSDGIRVFGDRLEIPTDGLLTPRYVGHFLWYRPDRRDHPGGRVAQAAPSHLDRFTSGLAKRLHAVGRVATDLFADVPIGEGYGGL